MNKFVVALILIAVYLIYKNIQQISLTDKEIQRDLGNIIALNSLIKDKLEIKDIEIEKRQQEIHRYNINYEAFNGTGCQNCHLDPKNLLPYPNREPLTLEKYIKVVRSGIDGVMPSYIDSPKKGVKDITDSELRRQYNILKNLYIK